MKKIVVGPGNAVSAKPLEVKSSSQFDADRMIRKFIKKVKNDGIIGEHVRSLNFIRKSNRKRMKKISSKMAEKQNASS